jgi:hypothetical protein
MHALGVRCNIAAPLPANLPGLEVFGTAAPCSGSGSSSRQVGLRGCRPHAGMLSLLTCTGSYWLPHVIAVHTLARMLVQAAACSCKCKGQ